MRTFAATCTATKDRSKRRSVPALSVALVLAIALPDPPDVRAQAAPAHPNVLIIVTDDQRGGVSIMPNVEHLFEAAGTRYSPAFATTPVCCPSRASIMTGRYAHNHGVKSNSNPEEGGAANLDHSTTLQAYLRGAGYHTGVVGKFLNPPWRLIDDPPHFDEWFTLGGEPLQRAWYDASFNDNGNIHEVDGYTTTVIRKWARSFIRRNAGAPWYLYVAPKAPHPPAIADAKYADERIPRWTGNPAVFETDKSDKPPYVQEAHQGLHHANKVRRAQYRALASVDDMVGALFDELRRLHELPNTLAFFISDNGLMWSEHGLHAKGVPYRHAINVPFFARWPDHIAKRAVDERFAANIDIAPTILDAVDVEPRVQQDGRSLLRTWHRDRILLEYWCNAVGGNCNRWASTWTPTHQYIEYYEAGDVVFREYYDLANDPWQLTNLLGDPDPTNDPSLVGVSAQLRDDRDCKGVECP